MVAFALCLHYAPTTCLWGWDWYQSGVSSETEPAGDRERERGRAILLKELANTTVGSASPRKLIEEVSIYTATYPYLCIYLHFPTSMNHLTVKWKHHASLP